MHYEPLKSDLEYRTTLRLRRRVEVSIAAIEDSPFRHWYDDLLFDGFCQIWQILDQEIRDYEQEQCHDTL